MTDAVRRWEKTDIVHGRGANTVKKIIAGIIVWFALGGCTAQTPSEDQLTGTWRFRGTGWKEIKGEASLGEIRLNPDGTFEARNVSGIVLKISDEALHDGQGTWKIDTSKGPVERLVERPAVVFVYEKHGIPFQAHYSVYEGNDILTFARDEEAGKWVKYQKKR